MDDDGALQVLRDVAAGFDSHDVARIHTLPLTIPVIRCPAVARIG